MGSGCVFLDNKNIGVKRKKMKRRLKKMEYRINKRTGDKTLPLLGNLVTKSAYFFLNYT